MQWDGFSLHHDAEPLLGSLRSLGINQGCWGGGSGIICKCLISYMWYSVLLAGTLTGLFARTSRIATCRAWASSQHSSLRFLKWQFSTPKAKMPKKSQAETIATCRVQPWKSYNIPSTVIKDLFIVKANEHQFTHWGESINSTWYEENVGWEILLWPSWGNAMCQSEEGNWAIMKVGL